MPTYRNGQLGELVEPVVTWAPGLQGGVDLEAATKTISNTSENATEDYSSSHNVPAPADARIAVNRGAMRLTVTIDSWGGGGVALNYRVKRGGVSVSTGVLEAAGGTGQKIISWDITAAITGAQTNTLFLWVDAGTCVISEVTMWSAVGKASASTTIPIFTITQAANSLVQILGYFTRVGTGTFALRAGGLSGGNSSVANYLLGAVAATLNLTALAVAWLGAPSIGFFLAAPSVATDFTYINSLELYFRSQG